MTPTPAGGAEDAGPPDWWRPADLAASGLLEACTFAPAGTPVTCAVSGGADSLALLALAVAAGCEVTAVHVDHGLRDGSAAEADVVRAAAAAFGAGFRALRVTLEPGPNLEARARAARYRVLPGDVLTGHTADDQAETVLLNLLRGAGLDGLAGIAPGPRHPILRLRRRETMLVCRQMGLTPVDDPSNADPVHRRNRVRHELMPLFDDIAQRDVAGVIARQASLLRDEAELLDGLAAALDPTDARALAAAPVALSRRAVRRWLREGSDHPPDSTIVERVLAVARGQDRSTDIGGDRRVARTGQRLRIEPLPGLTGPGPQGQ